MATNVSGGIDITESQILQAYLYLASPASTPVMWERWYRIVQLLSDLSPAYQRNQLDIQEYDVCAEQAHDLCVGLGIPYGQHEDQEEG